MNKKMELMHKVWKSTLNASQKMLLTYLISKADERGVAWPTTADLCAVMGIKHEKNFRGVGYYLPGLVTVGKTTTKNGLQNKYTLTTPAIEGLPQGEVVLKATERRGTTPATEGVTTPATADTTPSTEGTGTPSTEGTYRTSIEQVHRTRERTITEPVAPDVVANAPTSLDAIHKRDLEELDGREFTKYETYKRNGYSHVRALSLCREEDW